MSKRLFSRPLLWSWCFVTALTFQVAAASPAIADSSDAELPHIADEILVEFEPAASDDEINDALREGGMEVREHVRTARMKAAGRPGITRMKTRHGAKEAIRRLKRHPAVRFAEPNWVYQHQATANDPYYTAGYLWGVYGDTTPPANQFGSQAVKAWTAGHTGNRQVYVGVIDEGIQFDHPDLAANIWTNPFDPVDGVDNDGNGYVDDVHGWNFFGNNNTIYEGATDDHGTHVAGTIGAAGGNGQGIAGLNWAVTLISAKFLGPQGGTTADAVEAIDYFIDLKVRHGLNIVVLNNSWGGGGYSQALHGAIIRAAKAGILFAAAAGNGDSNGNGLNNDVSANYPSNYDTTSATPWESAANYDGVIAVAAIDQTGARARFSNYGAAQVDLGAPGVSILSTVPGNGYAYYSGTSMATPHVAGAVALYASMHPGRSALQIRTALLDAARATATAAMQGATTTGGRLNLSSLLVTTPPQTPAVPSGLAAIAGDAFVALTWNTVSGATAYSLKRSTVPSGPFTPIAANSNVASYTDNSVVNGVTYYYIVSALSGTLESANSMAVTATPVASPPGQPSVNWVTAAAPGTLRNNFTGWIGLKLTPKSALTVSELGRWMAAGNSRTHTLKLVAASTGMDIPNGSTVINMNGAAVGSFKYGRLLSPVTLAANTSYYLVSDEQLNGDGWHDYNTVVTPRAGILCDGAVYAGSGYPWTVVGGLNRSYGPLDLKYLSSGLVSFDVTLSALPSAGGTVAGQGSYVTGSVATVTATASASYRFVNWTENGNTVAIASTYSFTADRARALVANFALAPVTYTVATTVSPLDGGSVAGGGTFSSGQTVTLTATANPGFVFARWTENGNVVSTVSSFSFAATISRALTAVFEPVSSTGEQAFVRSLVAGRSRADFSGWVGMQIIVGTQPLRVTALGRYNAAGNSRTHTMKIVRAGDGTDVPNASATANMSGGVNGQFQYTPLAVPVTLEAGQRYYVVSQEVLGGDTWHDLNTQIVPGPAAAVEGAVYFLGRWERPSGPNTTYVPVDFKYSTGPIESHAIATSVGQPGMGTVTGGGTYPVGSSVTVAATASAGHMFVSWMENGQIVSSSPNYSCIVSGPRQLTANFAVGSAPGELPFITSAVPGRVRYEAGWGGMRFTVGSSPITLTSLGRLCAPGNSRPHTLKLVAAATGQDVPQGSVVVSMSGATAGEFQYQPLSAPVTLLANTTYYLISEEAWYADAWYDFDTTVTTSTAARCDGAGYLWYGWVNQGAANTARGPVSFKYRQ